MKILSVALVPEGSLTFDGTFTDVGCEHASLYGGLRLEATVGFSNKAKSAHAAMSSTTMAFAHVSRCVRM
jgi:hypothetical protein